jgi:poly(3-hydroxybutyrate) depolymerase
MKIHFRKFILVTLVNILLSSWHLVAQKLPEGPQVLTFFSDADDTEQPYGLYIPKNYDPSKKYPLVMMLHGAGSNHRLALRRVFGKSNGENENDVEASRYFPKWDDVDFIVATPYARGTAGYQGIPEQDVYDVLADVKKRFSIDENRTYLTGLSMGGGGTLWIGLTRPDIWAAIAPVCPAPPVGTIALAPNALNFPVQFFHGDADPVVPVEGTRKWVSDMQDIGVEVTYKEFVDVKHDSWVSAYDAEFIFDWFKPIERIQYPNQVRFVSKLYKYNKAYWVEFDKLIGGELAEIDAKFEKANILKITTKKLDGFTLHLKDHPMFKPNQEITVNVDQVGLKVKTTANLYFVKSEKGWAASATKSEAPAMSKRKGLEGPLFDAFSSRNVYVYGTLDNPPAEELKRRLDLANEAANWSVYRGSFLGRMMFFPRVLSDKELRASDADSSNLVLFGTKETNSIIASHAAKLPVSFNAKSSDFGLFYVFPVNQHYVAISSGLPWWKGAKDEGFPFVPVPYRKLPEYKDIVLFKSSGEQIILNEYFDQDWKLSEATKAALKSSGAIIINQ